MTTAREILNASSINNEDKEKSNAAALELVLDKDAFKKQQAEILSRSIVQDNLSVKIPDGMYGEWIPNNGNSINEAKIKGFEFYSASPEEQERHGIHGDGTSRLVIGDTVFMTMPKWKKDIHNDLQAERIRKLHSSKTNQAEETSFMNESSTTGTNEITTFNESHASNVAVSKT